jgi:hypothetical protein
VTGFDHSWTGRQDQFWAGYASTLARVRASKPRTLDALAAILNAFQPPSSGVAFFGNNDDDTLADALTDAGWHVEFIEGGYLWQASPLGSDEWIHYVEGDLDPGRWKPAYQ